MSELLDVVRRGRRVRIFEADADDYILVVDGSVHHGFTSRVDVFSAARRLSR